MVTFYERRQSMSYLCFHSNGNLIYVNQELGSTDGSLLPMSRSEHITAVSVSAGGDIAVMLSSGQLIYGNVSTSALILDPSHVNVSIYNQRCSGTHRGTRRAAYI